MGGEEVSVLFEVKFEIEARPPERRCKKDGGEFVAQRALCEGQEVIVQCPRQG